MNTFAVNTSPVATPSNNSASHTPVVVRWRNDQAQARQNALEQALRAHPGRPLLLLRADLSITPAQAQRWARHLAQAPAEVDAITVLSNADERYNPFSDHPAPPSPQHRSGLGQLIYWLADGWLRQAPSFPADRLLLRPAAAQRLALREHWPTAHDPQMYGYRIQLADDIYIDEPDQKLFIERPAQRWEAPPSESHSRLAAELRRVLDAGTAELPDESGPCLLHITHSWGGGINRWLLDWCRHDTKNHHLILRSHGDWQRARHGSQLALYLYVPEQKASREESTESGGHVVLLREFQLTPAISASRISDSQYQAVLNWVLQRFPVQQLLISSLIGHSLDVLQSGLPSIYALHDFYPAWPLLTVNPLPYRRKRGDDATSDPGTSADTGSGRPEMVHYDLQSALREQHKREFSEDQIEHWQRLSQIWREACQQAHIRLVAPTQSAARIIAELNPSLRGQIEVISHGLPAWKQALPAASNAPIVTGSERPLRLLIPGRLSKHKGLELLKAALPQLRSMARITLLGCDRDGMQLLGENNVDIIANYDHEALPELIQRYQPDAALLLSVVPETFSYTLSEMWSLGVVPIATELGSFAERISDFETGILIPPQAEELVQAVRQLYAEPEILNELRAHIQALPKQTMATMLAAYNALWPKAKPLSRGAVQPLILAGDLAELYRNRLWWQDERRELEEARDNLLQELTKRTSWARSAQAQAERLGQQLSQQYQQHEQQLVQHREWLRISDEHAAAARAQRDDYGRQLEMERKRVDDLYAQQAALAQVLNEKQAEERRLRESLNHSERELRQRRQDIQHLQQALADNAHHLQQSQYYYQLLQSQYQAILDSRSWRITRPLRVAGRIARTLKRARVHLPWRWPWLTKRLLQSLISQGLKGTFQRLQSAGDNSVQSPVKHDSEEEILLLEHKPEMDEARAEGEQSHLQAPPAAVQLRLSAQPQLVVSLRPCASLHSLSLQLQALARLQQEFAMALVIHGVRNIAPENDGGGEHESSPTQAPELLDYLAQCSGFLLLPADGAAALAPAAELEQVLVTLDSAQIARPRYYLSLDGRSICSAQAIRSLMRSLEETPSTLDERWQAGRWARLGNVVDQDDHLLLPAADEPQQIAEHPLYHYSRPCPINPQGALLQPLMVDLMGLLLALPVTASATAESANGSVSEPGSSASDDLRQLDSAIIAQGFEQALPDLLWLDSFCRARWQPKDRPSDERAALPAAPCLLVVDAWVPTPDQDSGSLRMVQLLQVAQSIGWHVVFCSNDRSHRGDYTQALQRAGIEVWHAPYLQDFQSFLSNQGKRFDAVLLSRYYVAQELIQLVRKYSPQAQVLFDTVDLHFLREEREAELKQSGTLKRLAANTRKQELQLVDDCDVTLVVSPVEQQLLRELRPNARVEVLSNIHTVHGAGQAFAERKDILFIGGFQHPPNVDAMKWFVGEIWPQIHAALPDVQFHIIGSKMPDEIQQLSGQNLQIHGFVADIDPYLENCRLSVAPLRYGAGVKGKVNSSMSFGQPVVATSIAVEGMALVDGEETLVADDPQGFAAAVIRLYQDEGLWNRLAQSGLENIRQHFSIATAQQRLREILGSQDAGESASG